MTIHDNIPVKPPLNALIIEDSEDDLELLAYQINRGGYSLTFERVETEEQMKAALTTQAWDIVISDYQLPTFSAPAALACLRKLDLDVPFIVVSGVIDEETSVNILSAGAHDFILKGRWSRLIPAIQREVREAKERQARFNAEKNARLAAEQYRVIFETVGTPIMILDHRMMTRLVNAPFIKLLGVDESELIGNRKWLSFLDDKGTRGKFNKHFYRRQTQITEHLSFEVIVTDRKNQSHTLIATIAMIPGASEGIISLLDVSERVNADNVIRKRADELAVLHSIAMVCDQAVDEDILINQVANLIHQTLFRDILGVLLLDKTGQFLTHPTIPSAWGIGEQIVGVKFPLEHSIGGKVVTTGQPIRTGDVSTLPFYHQISSQTRSELCVPLKIGDKPIGVINVENQHTDAFSEDDERLLVTIAGQITNAIERLRTENELREQAQQLATIYEIAQEIVTARLEPEQVYRSIHRAIIKMMPCEAFVISRLGATQNTIDVVYAHDKDGQTPNMTIPITSGISGYVIRTGRPIIYNDLSLVTNLHDIIYFGGPKHTLATLAVPMRYGGQIIGCLSTQSYTKNVFTNRHLRLLELITSYAAIALENNQLLDEVRKNKISSSNSDNSAIKARN